MFRPVGLKALLVACAVLATCGCSVTVRTGEPDEATVSKAELERSVTESLTEMAGQQPDAVECPGPIKAKVGETIRCVLTAGGTRLGMTVTIKSYDNGRAKFDVQVDEQPLD
ncbi:DUF4333 domain-containing protein [Saccharomonospora sp. NPDC046836]|uniref:DUF4333 domain-containing protein n=1 Tax=Saccharomonospora sp. NPDC046836 TaxID=3156921 RepID=UPI0033C236B3